eukprot:jgi/Chlat1/883/Chrsp107S01321
MFAREGRSRSTANIAVDEELQELQKKYQLLEGDRRACWEASQWTIKQNRDTLAAVKRENRELRATLASIQPYKHIILHGSGDCRLKQLARTQ